MQLTEQDILRIDKQHIWHPYSSFESEVPIHAVERAEGVVLTFSNGTQVIDGMSSWWCAVHGYNHPRLNRALTTQLESMAHVMFGGLSHKPAAQLAKLLVEITPEPLTKVFFADSGSVSVEVAIKMAIQYWHSCKRPQKNKLLTIKQGYHGDTFGAMAVCDPVTGMHHLFNNNLTQHYFAEAPQVPFGQDWEAKDTESFDQLLSQHHGEIAAVILEPIVQATGGMNFYHPQFLQQVRRQCDQYEVLLIADEIATNFGRSGKLFACEHAAICPDIMCLGKALSGGYMTLAAALCSDKVAQGICEGEAGVFMHGPTFMANPLACAVSVENIRLLLESPWQQRVENIERQLKSELGHLRKHPGIKDIRVLGAIGVVEGEAPWDMANTQAQLIANGVWLRPFGKLLYTMPPFICETHHISQITKAIAACVNAL